MSDPTPPPNQGAPAQRESRLCDTCAQIDDHPRHVQFVAILHPVTGEPLDLSTMKHIDCCAADGCEVCGTHVEFAGGKKGAELVAHLTNLPADHAQALFDRHGVETPAAFRASEDANAALQHAADGGYPGSTGGRA